MCSDPACPAPHAAGPDDSAAIRIRGARQNNLKLDPARLNETLQLIASTYEDPQQVIELYRNDPNLMSSLRGRVMEEQVIDWIAERAEATEKAMTFAELMRPVA